MDSNGNWKIDRGHETGGVPRDNNQNAEGFIPGWFYVDAELLDSYNIISTLKSLYLVTTPLKAITITGFHTKNRIIESNIYPDESIVENYKEYVPVFNKVQNLQTAKTIRPKGFVRICRSTYSIDEIDTLYAMYRSRDKEAKIIARDTFFTIFNNIANELIN